MNCKEYPTVLRAICLCAFAISVWGSPLCADAEEPQELSGIEGIERKAETAVEAMNEELTKDSRNQSQPSEILPTDASGTPIWVVQAKRGEYGKIADTSHYFGVGISPTSQEEADQRARLDFGQTVETTVQSRVEENTTVVGKLQLYNAEVVSEVSTNVSLKGIGITGRWSEKDGGAFYSLIKLKRSEYLAILTKNIDDELAMREKELERERAELTQEVEAQRLEAERETARIERERLAVEQRRLEEQLKREKLAQKQLELEGKLLKYEEFLVTQPQAQLLSYRNAQLSSRVQHYALTIGVLPGIYPYDVTKLVTRVHAGYSLFRFMEISTTAALQDRHGSFDWGYQEFDLKLRLLNSRGKLVQLSLGLGGKATLYNIVTDFGYGWSLYGSAVVSLPMVLSSHVSLYGGMDRIALGFTTHPFFGWIGDAVGLILEATYFFDTPYRMGAYLADMFLLQAGLRLKGNNVATSIYLENHQTLAMTLEIFVGPETARQ